MAKYLREINGDEETQNDVYASILGKSLEYGPEIAQRLHKHEDLEITSESRISVVQEKLDSDDDRVLDWVITGPQVIGFESKKQDDLKPGQLVKEMADLRRHSQTPVLVAITDSLRPPTNVLQNVQERIGEEGSLVWQSWHQVAHEVYQLSDQPEILPPEQRPLLDILTDMFESENYEPRFGGIEIPNISAELLERREDNLLALVTDIAVSLSDDRSWEEPDPKTYTSDAWSTLQNDFYYIWPPRVTFRFLREQSDDDSRSIKQSAIALLTSLFEDEFMAILDINADVDTGNKLINQRTVTENADQIVEISQRNGFQLWTSNNSWDHGTHPIQKHSPNEARELLADPDTFGYSPHKRVLIGRRLQSAEFSPQEFVFEIGGTFELLRDNYLEQAEIFDDVFPQV